MDPADTIHHLSKLSYDAVQQAQPDKKHRPGFRSTYKDGWSPEAMAHKRSEGMSSDTTNDGSGHQTEKTLQ